MKHRKDVNSGCRIKCGALDPIEIHYFSINQFDCIPRNKRGWYCWFYVPETIDRLSEDIIKPYRPMATIDSIFGIKYAGKLENKSKKISLDKGEYCSELQATMLAFSSPLYIGKSKSLHSRLKTHKSQLENYLLLEQESSDKDSCDIQTDSDQESSFFGQRMSLEMNKNNIVLSELYVKCVYSDTNNSLESVEKVLNRVFLPPYGRR